MPIKSNLLSIAFKFGLSLSVIASLTQVVQARPDTKAYSCPALKNFVTSHGAVTMNTKNSYVYKRFVSNRSYCQMSQLLERTKVPSASGSCFLNICYDRQNREQGGR